MWAQLLKVVSTAAGTYLQFLIPLYFSRMLPKLVFQISLLVEKKYVSSVTLNLWCWPMNLIYCEPAWQLSVWKVRKYLSSWWWYEWVSETGAVRRSAGVVAVTRALATVHVTACSIATFNPHQLTEVECRYTHRQTIDQTAHTTPIITRTYTQTYLAPKSWNQSEALAHGDYMEKGDCNRPR